MSEFPAFLKERLQGLDVTACRRSFVHRNGIDFSSNDYLGLSTDPVLRERAFRTLKGLPIGSSASRLLRGHLPVFDDVEFALARFCGRESSVIYASGYQANVGLLSALLRPGDLAFSDQFNHASIIDGIRLSGAEKKIYPHANASALKSLLESHAGEKRPKWIVSESLFSMDGDLAPLKELVDLAEEFSAHLIVDEAHATGIWGKFDQGQGGGLVQALGLEKRVLATVHPAGKAMGVGGAWVCGDTLLKEYLVNFSRSLIFSTAPSPFLPALILASLQYWQEVGPARANELLRRSNEFQNHFIKSSGRIYVPRVPGLIIPIVIGDNSEALVLAQLLQEQGFDIRAIRPPTVPEGSARLRVTLNWSQSPGDLNHLIQIFGKLIEAR